MKRFAPFSAGFFYEKSDMKNQKNAVVEIELLDEHGNSMGVILFPKSQWRAIERAAKLQGLTVSQFVEKLTMAAIARKRATITIENPETVRQLQEIADAREITLQELVNDELDSHVADVCGDNRRSEYHGDVEFDSMEEAERVMASLDALDGNSFDRRFVLNERGLYQETEYAGHQLPPTRSELAVA